MSMMKFDDSKIKEIRKRKEQGLPPLPTGGDVVEQSKNAKGGSELIYQRVKERVPEDLWNYFQVILSRVREYEDKPKILWFQDTSKDPEVQFLKDKSYRDKFERFVFPSDWSLEKYNIDLGVEYEKSVVLKNAIEPIPTAAPIAKPSPKLCNPIPIEIINPIATGFEKFNESAFVTILFPLYYYNKSFQKCQVFF